LETAVALEEDRAAVGEGVIRVREMSLGEGGALCGGEHVPDGEPDARVDEGCVFGKDEVAASVAGGAGFGEDYVA
jgi:hypothetical protein